MVNRQSTIDMLSFKILRGPRDEVQRHPFVWWGPSNRNVLSRCTETISGPMKCRFVTGAHLSPAARKRQ
jgi:hypothetical protein